MVELNANQRFIADLKPDIERLFDYHIDHAKEWYPHELVPYDLGRTYKTDDPWSPEEYPLEPGVRSAIFTNLLTEDNLPYYYETISGFSPSRDHPWAVWTRRWTSEEDRHAEVIREWVHVTRAIDPHTLEQGRMAQMALGEVPQPPTVPDLLIYVSLQELATRVAHGNTGRALDRERGGKDVMAQVAADEYLHHVFYRDLAKEAFKLSPMEMMQSLLRQVRGFDMPGTGIIDFEAHTKAIAEAGIYDYDAFRTKVVDPTLRAWEIETMTGLTEEAELARAGLYKHLDRRAKAIERMRESQLAKQAGRGAVLLDQQ